MKVKNFYNLNQFYIKGNGGEEYLQSYNSLVIEITNYNGCYQTIILGKDWDYSRTTLKHVYLFLEEKSKLTFDGVTNKKAYINKLLKEYQKDKNKFLDKYNFAIVYNEEMI